MAEQDSDGKEESGLEYLEVDQATAEVLLELAQENETLRQEVARLREEIMYLRH